MSFRRATPGLLMTIVAIFSAQAVSGFPPNKSPSSENDSVCRTPRCLRFAEILEHSVNKSADPCDDFYEFTCGRWMRENPVPKHLSSVNTFSMIHEITQHRIKEILEDSDKPTDTNSLRTARKIYSMCMDTDALERVGVEPLLKALNNFGGWPIMLPKSQWNSDNSLTWQDIYNRVARNFAGGNGIITNEVFYDLRDVRNYETTIFVPSLFLERDVLLSPDSVREKIIYSSYIHDAVKILASASHSDVSMSDVAKDVRDLVAFEVQIAGIIPPNAQLTDIGETTKRLTIGKFQERYDNEEPKNDPNSQIDWLTFVNSAVAKAGKRVDSSESLIVVGIDYFLKLKRVLSETPVRTIVNYVLWYYVKSMLTYTNGATRLIQFQMKRQLFNITEEKQRWIQCVENENLHDAVAYEYVRRYFSPDAKAAALSILRDVVQSVETQINGSTWMDEETKQKSMEKLRYMTPEVGYPDWYNDTSIDIYYRELKTGSNYFEAIHELATFRQMKDLRRIGKPVDKRTWFMFPTDVNAYYAQMYNTIIFSAATLSDVLFDWERPRFTNYATFGMIAGHEITHGFDNNGGKHDKLGNAVQWWSNETIETYNNRVKCFVDQYNEYTIPELEVLNKTVHVNGEVTLGENIADTAGLMAAYEAFKVYKARTGGGEVRLPGFENYTTDQLFFMSFGRLFCENTLPYFLDTVLRYDPHPRGHTRIRGAAANLEGFSQAFNCPAGSPMNPDKKCKLW